MRQKKKLTKWQKKKRRLLKVKGEFGVEDIYFGDVESDWFSNDYIRCSRANLFKEQRLTSAQLNGLLLYMVKGRYTIKYLDDDIKFNNLDELREYILIQKLSGIWK